MQVIEITSLTGHSPYNISICDITLTYCYVVATGVVSVPPTLQLPIPPQLEGANQVLVVVTDAIGCQEFILQTCPTTPTPTPTITPTPTPTRIIICNCISFQNTTLGTLTFEYTQCDGKIFNGEIESGTTLYYCGRLPSAEVGVSISINDECIKNTCSDIYLTPTPTPSITPTVTPTPTVTNTPTVTPTPTPSITPTVTPTPTVTNTPTVTPTPTITSTPTPTPTTPIIACLCYTLSNDPPPPPTPALGATNFQYVDCSGNTQNVTVFNGFPIDVCAQDSTVVRTGGDPGSIGPAIVDCCLTNPNCYYYDVTISSTDLATSTGNMIYPNNTVFVEYTDCNGGTVSTPYTVAGTYFNDICADDTQPITVLYYQNDLGYLTISSFVTQQGNCP